MFGIPCSTMRRPVARMNHMSLSYPLCTHIAMTLAMAMSMTMPDMSCTPFVACLCVFVIAIGGTVFCSIGALVALLSLGKSSPPILARDWVFVPLS